MSAHDYCPGHPGSPAPSGDASDLRRVECDRCFLDYVHETVGTEGSLTRDDLARLFTLASEGLVAQSYSEADTATAVAMSQRALDAERLVANVTEVRRQYQDVLRSGSKDETLYYVVLDLTAALGITEEDPA